MLNREHSVSGRVRRRRLGNGPPPDGVAPVVEHDRALHHQTAGDVVETHVVHAHASLAFEPVLRWLLVDDEITVGDVEQEVTTGFECLVNASQDGVVLFALIMTGLFWVIFRPMWQRPHLMQRSWSILALVM